jgi:hypothetical protein
MEHMNKIIIPVAKPRNPLVALTRTRKAGAHGQNRRQGRRDERRLAD